MLAIKQRFIVYNKTGVTLDFLSNTPNELGRITYRGKKPTASAGISYGTEQMDDANTNLADGATEALVTIDNTTDQWFGLDGTFTVATNNTSASGDVVLLRETSADGGGATVFPSEVADWDPDTDAYVVAVLTLNGAEQKSTSFSI